MLVERRVFAVSKFYDTWDFDKVNAGPVVKSARNRGTRHYQDVEAAIILHKGVSYGLTPSQMTEAKRVVAVHHYSGMFKSTHHAGPFTIAGVGFATALCPCGALAHNVSDTGQ